MGGAGSKEPTRLLHLPDELLVMVARALLHVDPQVDAQAVCRLAASSTSLRRLVRGHAVVVAELQAARAMLTRLRQHELLVAAGRARADAALPFERSDYKHVAQQLPAPETEINLHGCQWRDAEAETRGQAVACSLQLRGSLATLLLGANSVQGARGRAVACLLQVSGSLNTLGLMGCNIGVEGARALAEAIRTNSSLAMLSLNDNNIGDEGARAIADAIRADGPLTTLYLQGNNIGDEGARAIADAIRASSSLAKLLLSTNDIGDVGAEAIGEALRANGSVATLGLACNRIGFDAKQSLRDAVRGREGFVLSV